MNRGLYVQRRVYGQGTYNSKHLYTNSQGSPYELRGGEAGDGGNNRRFFARFFLGRLLCIWYCADVLSVTDGMTIGGSRRE